MPGKKNNKNQKSLDNLESQETWFLLRHAFRNPYWNLCIEESIIKSFSSNDFPIVRIWRNETSIILGRGQNPTYELNYSEHKEFFQKYPVIKRFTGGGTVFHDWGNLNISLFLPRNHHLVPRSVTAIYEVWNRPILSYLSSLGLKTNSVTNSLLIGGQKISGQAAIYKREVVLVHGTLLVHSNLQQISRILGLSPIEIESYRHLPLRKSMRSNKQTVTSLQAQGHNLEMSSVINGIIDAFQETYNVKIVPRNLTEENLTLAKEIFNSQVKESQFHKIL
ncbi:MAG: biotin/lipoate A/B protein ligase family protein [Candidatus Hermodarchaeota archaeon]